MQWMRKCWDEIRNNLYHCKSKVKLLLLLWSQSQWPCNDAVVLQELKFENCSLKWGSKWSKAPRLCGWAKVRKCLIVGWPHPSGVIVPPTAHCSHWSHCPLELQTNLRKVWSFTIMGKAHTSAFKILYKMGFNPRQMWSWVSVAKP